MPRGKVPVGDEYLSPIEKIAAGYALCPAGDVRPTHEVDILNVGPRARLGDRKRDEARLFCSLSLFCVSHKAVHEGAVPRAADGGDAEVMDADEVGHGQTFGGDLLHEVGDGGEVHPLSPEDTRQEERVKTPLVRGPNEVPREMVGLFLLFPVKREGVRLDYLVYEPARRRDDFFCLADHRVWKTRHGKETCRDVVKARLPVEEPAVRSLVKHPCLP